MSQRCKLVLQCAFLAASAAQAQTGSLTGSLNGRITNAITGELVAGVTVHLIPLQYTNGERAQPQGDSQADGTFRIDSVPVGNYVITAEREGFVPNQLNTKSRFVTIQPGQAVSDISVQLTPGGTIVGKVEDEEGNPVPGALVEALSRVTTRGKTTLRQGSTTDADATGNFSLSQLAPGDYYVLVEAKPKQKQQPTKDGELVLTVYPHELSFDAASTVPVAAGQIVADIDVRIRRTATYHIRGKISESLGTQVEKIRITIAPRGAMDSSPLARTAEPDPDRSFDIADIVPGAYTLRVTVVHSHQLLARNDVDVGGGNLNGVVLAITPPVTLTGHVTVDSPSAASSPTNVAVMARPLEDISHAAQAFTKVGADGSFALSNLGPGPYVINVAAVGSGMYVKSISMNGQDIMKKEIDLSQTGAGQLEVVIRSGASEVDGTVVSQDQSLQNQTTAAVVLAPEDVGPDGWGVMFSYLRHGPSFSFANVAPGKYFAYAVDRADPNLWQNPDFLQGMQSQGMGVQVEENGRQQIQLPKIPFDQVAQAAERLGLTLQ